MLVNVESHLRAYQSVSEMAQGVRSGVPVGPSPSSARRKANVANQPSLQKSSRLRGEVQRSSTDDSAAFLNPNCFIVADIHRN